MPFKGIINVGIARIVISLLLCLTYISCDIFETRKASDPNQIGSIPPKATIDTLVLYNMRNAFREGNKVNYLYCFSDGSFSFEATARARGAYPNTFDGWDKSSEERYFSNVIGQLARNSTAELGFGPYTSIPLGFGDSSRIEADYQLTIPHTKVGVTKNFSGHAQFTLARNESAVWSIIRWVDNGPPLSDSTWSDLKSWFF